jgi:hypothetical protein
MDVLLGIWERVAARHAPLPLPAAWLTIAAAALIVLVPATWRVGRHVITIVHEGGHAVAATLTGRPLGGIRLHSDTSGLTVSRGRPSGPGMILTILAGYAAPPLLGLGAARMLGLGYDVGLLWLLLAGLALLLVQIRNWFGLWSVAVTGAVLAGWSRRSCSSAPCAPCWNCTRRAPAAPGRSRTPTNWRASPGCPAWSGSGCPSWSRRRAPGSPLGFSAWSARPAARKAAKPARPP